MKDIDYIPRRDGSFDAFQSNFEEFAQANLGATLSPAQLAELAALRVEWETNWKDAIEQLALARAAIARKRAAQEGYRKAIRRAAAIVQADPATTDGLRASLGLTIPDTTRTRVAIPTTAPLLGVAKATSQTVILRVIDEASKSRRKPDGVVHCQIFVAFGDAQPLDLESCTFLGIATNGTFTQWFDGAYVGKRAHFVGRWVNRRGQPGPRGGFASVIVPM